MSILCIPDLSLYTLAECDHKTSSSTASRASSSTRGECPVPHPLLTHPRTLVGFPELHQQCGGVQRCRRCPPYLAQCPRVVG